MSGVPAGLRARQFGRLLLLQSTLSFERMQGLGLAWALEPWLERLYPSAADRRAALKRHSEYFNTQPYVASLIVGFLCALEEKASALPADKRGPAYERLGAVKKTLGASLAGIGDAFFWGALRPTAAAAAVLVGVAALPFAPRHAGLWMAATYLLAYNVPALWLRWRGLALGYAWAEQLPSRLKSLRVQRWVTGARAAGVALTLALAVTLAAQAGREQRAFGAAALAASWLACALLPARVNALRLYGAGCAAGFVAALGGWL